MPAAPDVLQIARPPQLSPPVQYSERQKQILDGLLQIVLSEGFRTLRLTTLTKRLSTSFSTLYELAPGKDELVALVIEWWYQRGCARAYERLRSAQDPIAQLNVWTDFGVMGTAQTSRAFWHDAKANAATRGIITIYSHYYVEVLRAILDAGIEQGVFRKVNTHLLAVVWESFTDMLADSNVVHEETQTLRGYAEDWVDLVLHGLLRR